MASSILETLAQAARQRVQQEQEAISADEMRRLAHGAATPAAMTFKEALAAPGMSFICECKKASPSKGLIAPEYEPVSIALDYQAAGASAISVLTEPTQFLGSVKDLEDVAHAVTIPVLRKDFVVDPYMIYQAKHCGASAVLLICSLLDAKTLADYLSLCASLGLDALVEAHDAHEVEQAVDCGAQIIGVNNRNLADFSVDFSNSLTLREQVPSEILFVTESGIKTPGDIALLAHRGVNAVLIGETLMRAADKCAMLQKLKAGATAEKGTHDDAD